MSNNVRQNKSIVMKKKGLGMGRQTPPMPRGNDAPTRVNVGAKTPTDPTHVDNKQAPAPAPAPAPQRTVVKGKANTRCCVGGLLVVSGPYVGLFKPIFMGGNLVGRSETCEASFPNDAEISSAQVRIDYFSKTNQYVISPNGGSQSTYLNGEPLVGPASVSYGDMVELSPATTVRFITACDEYFAWAEPKPQADEERAYRNPSREQ